MVTMRWIVNSKHVFALRRENMARGLNKVILVGNIGRYFLLNSKLVIVI